MTQVIFVSLQGVYIQYESEKSLLDKIQEKCGNYAGQLLKEEVCINGINGKHIFCRFSEKVL